MDHDEVFRALADPNRRLLLDALRIRDGQNLGQLCELIAMSRYGVMKHLRVLEKAGLITCEWVGREKYHHLNSVPIQLVYERWVSNYARPWAGALSALKRYVEENEQMEKHIQMIFVQASAEKVWQALTDGALTKQYYFGSSIEAEWKVGGKYRYVNPDGSDLVTGEVIEIDPPHRLVTSFTPHFVPVEIPATQVTWLIEAEGDACKVTIIHEGVDTSTELGGQIGEGWSRILSGLKTLLETGNTLLLPPMGAH